MKEESHVISLVGKTPQQAKEEIDEILQTKKYLDLIISPEGSFLILITSEPK